MVNAAAAPDTDEEVERPPPPPEDDVPSALRGGALPLARSAAFFARCVAKVCSWAALSAGPVSQEGSLVVGGGEEGAGAGAGAGDGAGTGAVAVGLEATLEADLGMVMDGAWEGWVGMDDVQCAE
jgi:hypothetical protein